MRKVFLFALSLSVIGAANAQEADSIKVETPQKVVTQEVQNAIKVDSIEGQQFKLTKDVYDMQENGDLFQGLTKRIGFDRMVAPHGLEVTYDKTVHLIFPSAVKYVDLGSPNLIAGNILRNGYYYISATINGIVGQDCDVEITVADWESPVTQSVSLGQ